MSWIRPDNVFRPFSSDFSFRSLLDEFDNDDFFADSIFDSGGSGSRLLDRMRRRHGRLLSPTPATPSTTTRLEHRQSQQRQQQLYQQHQQQQHQQQHQSHQSTPSTLADSPHRKNWTTAVDLVGFRPEEIAVKAEGDRLRIMAKREDGEDLNEVRRTLVIPQDVDADRLSTTLTKEGALVVKAPLLASSTSTAASACGDSSGVTSQCDDTISTCSQDFSWEDLRCLVRGSGIQPLASLVGGGDGNFRAEIPVREFMPEEIRVRLKGDQVMIEAECKQEREGQVEMRRLERSFTLPSSVDAENLVSRLSEDGRLMLEAPLKATEATEAQRGIPIEGVGKKETESAKEQAASAAAT